MVSAAVGRGAANMFLLDSVHLLMDSIDDPEEDLNEEQGHGCPKHHVYGVRFVV